MCCAMQWSREVGGGGEAGRQRGQCPIFVEGDNPPPPPIYTYLDELQMCLSCIVTLQPDDIGYIATIGWHTGSKVSYIPGS